MYRRFSNLSDRDRPALPLDTWHNSVVSMLLYCLNCRQTSVLYNRDVCGHARCSSWVASVVSCPHRHTAHAIETLNNSVKTVKKVKYVDLYSASSRSASNALPLPVSRRWSPQANPTARHPANTARPYGLVYHAICLFTFPAYAGYLFSLGRLRLSRPVCLVPRRGGLPT